MEDIAHFNEPSGRLGHDAESRLELLTGLIEDLSLELDLDTMANKALDTAIQLIGVDAGSVALLMADGEHLCYRWHVWQGDEDSISEMQQPFRINHGLAGKAMRSGKTEIVEDYASYDEALQSFIAAGVKSVLATPIFKQDGQVLGIFSLANINQHYEFSPARVRLAEAVARQFSVAIQRHELLESLQKNSRALQTLSAGNEAMMHAHSEDDLLQRVCSVIVDTEGYLGAWVAFKGTDSYKSLTPHAVAGINLESLLAVEYSWAESQEGIMPPGQAARTGKAARVNNVFLESECECCRELAREVGYQSVLALPLLIDGETVGVLVIYAKGINAFSNKEVALLTDLAKDISYGISAQRIRIKYKQGVEELKNNEKNLHNIINHEVDGIMVLDANDIILFTNPALERMLGREVGSSIGTPFGVPITFEGFSEIELIRQDGSLLRCEMRVAEVEWLNKPVRLVSVHDISERIKLEQEREENRQHQQEMLVETITAMSNAVETRDPYTAGHMHRVSDISVAIAEQMGLEKDQIEGIRLGGIIHDIGKLYVPAEILNRPGRLSLNEFEIIKSHAQVGYDIIKGISFSWPVAEMVYQHHERIDGSGYPNGLKRNEIVLEARILAVADVVEAMSSHRPYRASLGIAPAMDEIRRNRGKFYDEAVVDACLQVVEMGQFSIEKKPGAM